MSVSKSVLARRAARVAFSASAGPPRCRPMALAIWHTRCMRSPCVPNWLWYTTLDRPSTRDSSVRLRSWLKKNWASARRGRTTRSLPPTTALRSAGLILLTIKNRLLSLPAASSKGKYFWFAFMVRIRHSCGTSKNSASKLHAMTVGRSTRPVTSSSKVSSSTGCAPRAAAAACNCRAMSARRSSKLAITAPSSVSVFSYASACAITTGDTRASKR